MRPKRQKPEPGQESVWDYPRPPRVEASSKQVKVMVGNMILADSTKAQRVLETSHPPVYYLPQISIDMSRLVQNDHSSFCEFKGRAVYWTLRLDDKQTVNVAWSYPNPVKGFEAIKDHLAFYPSKVDACFVDGERVKAQAGDFYGGWITRDIVGPFKGGTGTRGW